MSSPPVPEEPPAPPEEEVVELPIDGVLDLHHFHPREVKNLVSDYLDACKDKGIQEVRLIHGKGSGQLREKVHSVLRGHPSVISFSLSGDRSGWGATVARLKLG